MKYDNTDKCCHVSETVSCSRGDVSQSKDGAVRMELFIISAFQVGHISCLQNVGPQEHKDSTVVPWCSLLNAFVLIAADELTLKI